MPVTIRIDIRGAKEMAGRLDRAEALIRKMAMLGGMHEATKYVAKNAAEYPPTTEANAPPPPYYIRGTGTQYKTYNRKESEQLNLHWDRMVSERKNGVLGVVKNEVSYAPWVHSVKRQTWFHKYRTKWRNIEGIKRDVEQGVVKIFRDGVARVLSSFGR